LGASLSEGQAHFSSGYGFMVGIGKSKLCTKFEVPSPSRGEILKGTPKFWGAPLAKGHPHFSPGCDFMMSLGKPKLCTKLEIAGFSHV